VGGGGRRGGGAPRWCAPLIAAIGGGRWRRGNGNGGRGNGGGGKVVGVSKAAATIVRRSVHTVGHLYPDSEADKWAHAVSFFSNLSRTSSNL
jgi:hypothetical protein